MEMLINNMRKKMKLWFDQLKSLGNLKLPAMRPLMALDRKGRSHLNFIHVCQSAVIQTKGVTMKKFYLWMVIFLGVTVLLFSFSKMTIATPTDLLGWGPSQDAAWQQMYAQNHEVFQDLKYKADNVNYASDAIADAIYYLVTGNLSYAQSAYNQISYYAGVTKPGQEPSGRDETRQMFMRLAMMYNWISDALSAQDKANFKDILVHWTDLCLNNQPPWGTRASDSDELVGHYFGMAIFALAIQDEDPTLANEILYGPTGTTTPPLGGLDATGQNYDTQRNAIADFAKKAAGGQWMESSNYNLNTVQMLITGVEAINNFLGENKFPEITALYPKFAETFVQELIPTLNDSFKWGDTDITAGLNLYRRLAVESTIGGVTNDPIINYVLWEPNSGHFHDYGSSYPDSMFYLFANPYGPQTAPSGVTYNNSSGHSTVFHHSGWNSSDSFFASLVSNKLNVDHELETLTNFMLYRNGGWTLKTPYGYLSEVDAPLSNALMVSGAFGWIKQARGVVGIEIGNDFVYHAGTQGGHPYNKSYYNPPQPTVHENMRSTLYLHNENGSDSIIIFDRVDAEDPATSQSSSEFNRYSTTHKNRILAAGSKHQWIIHMPDSAPSILGNTMTWNANGETVTLKTFMTNYMTQFIDEVTNSAGGSNPWLGAGTVPNSQKKYQLRIIPSSLAQWQTFLNVIHVGSPFMATQLLAVSGEQAKGVKLEVGSQNTVAIFNGTQGPIPPLEPEINGYVTYNSSSMLNALKAKRNFETGFTMNVDTDGFTKVFLMDLNPNKQWLLTVNGGPVINLTVPQSGMAQFDIDAVGTNQITVSSGNELPVAIISPPVQFGFVVNFDGSQSFDPFNNPLTYLWNFGDGQTSTSMSPTHTYAQGGTYTASLTINNGSLSDTESININVGVNQAPVVTPVGDKTITVGQTLTFNVNATDPDNNPLTLSAQLSNGNALSTIGASFTSSGNSGTFTWTPTASQLGIHTVSFIANDTMLSGMDTININVLADVSESHWLETDFPNSITAPMQIINDTSASNGKYIYAPNGSGNQFTLGPNPIEATYLVNITNAGQYRLWGRVIAPNGTDDSFWIRIDEGLSSATASNKWYVQNGSSWHWDLVSDYGGADPVIFNLSAGMHTIHVIHREDGAKIDKLLLTNNAQFTPSGSGSTAENLSGSNQPPTAIMSAPQINGFTVQFNGSQSSDPNNTPLTYSWNFGDGNTSIQMSPTHTYTVGGTFTVTLTVSDGQLTNTVSMPIILSTPNQAPFAVIGVPIINNLNVQFSNLSSDPENNPLTYSWNFGDGNTSTQMNPTHTYVQEGTYNVSLTVSDGTLTGSDSMSIQVTAPILVLETHWLETEYPVSIVSPMAVDHNSAASDSGYVYVPDGSGSYFTASSVMSTYTVNVAQAGEYVLWGRVIAPNGEANSFFMQIDNDVVNLWDVAQGGSWHWGRVSNRDIADPAIFNLAAGSHTIKIIAREDGTKIDKLLLINDLQYIPTGVGEVAENIPAIQPFNYSVKGVDMSIHTTGGPATSGAWNIWSNGYIAENIQFSQAGMYILKVKAKGEFAGSQSPLMEVRVDGNAVGSFSVTTSSYQYYNVTVFIPSGNHQIAIAFMNDYNPPGPADRNLIVDRLKVETP